MIRTQLARLLLSHNHSGGIQGAVIPSSLPAGGIIMYDGAVAPTGWALHGGVYDYFPRGASIDADVGTTGGTNTKTLTHSHTAAALSLANASHNHGGSANSSTANNGQFDNPTTNSGGTQRAFVTHTHTAIVDTVSHGHTLSGSVGNGGSAFDNRPPFTAVAFIKYSGASLATPSGWLSGLVRLWRHLNTHTHSADVVGQYPIGGIKHIKGSVASIPAGWALCDGNNGTPDMRGRFVAGAGNTYLNRATGGSATSNTSHTHGVGTLAAAAGGSHQHNYTSPSGPSVNNGLLLGSPDSDVANPDHTHAGKWTGDGPANHGHTLSGATASGGATALENRPAYYALAFVKRIA